MTTRWGEVRSSKLHRGNYGAVLRPQVFHKASRDWLLIGVYVAALVDSIVAGFAVVRGDWIQFTGAVIAATACAVLVAVRR